MKPWKAAWVADPHVGNHKVFGGKVTSGLNRRCRLGLRVLRHALRTAVGAGCTHFFVLGDLVDVDAPGDRIVWALAALFKEFEDELRIVLLQGNHDRASSAPDDNALAGLSLVAHVVTEPEAYPLDGGFIALVPFQDGDATTWFPGALQQAIRAGGAQPCFALGFHLGIRDLGASPWEASAKDAFDVEALRILMQTYGIGYAYAGNWHTPKAWSNCIFQCGTLCPTGFDNPGSHYGVMHTLSAMGERRPYLIAGPRFHKVRVLGPGPRYVVDGQPPEQANWHFLRLVVPPQDLVEARIWFETNPPTCLDWELVVDQQEARELAQEAQGRARAETALPVAVATFIEHAEIRHGNEVKALVYKYLHIT